MNISNHTVSDIFNIAFKQKPGKLFIDFGTGKTSYGELKTNIKKYTTYFKNNNICAGNRVVFSSKNEQFVCTFYLALLANGITAVLIDPECSAERAKAIIKHCDSDYLFFDQHLINTWNLNNLEYASLVPIETSVQTSALQKLLSRNNKTVNTFPNCINDLNESNIPEFIDPMSDAYILFTSGTTSSPKGVRISFNALFSHLKTLSNIYQLNENSILFNNLILSHADGMIQGPILTIYNSAQLHRPFLFSIQHIENIFDIIYREKITHWVMVPTMIGLIYQFKQNDADTLNNSSFRHVISCGGKLESLLWEQFENKFKTLIINGYGLTETVTGGIFAGTDKASHKIGTIGKPVDCEAKIVDNKGNEVTQNTKGEIWLKGSLIMNGYLNAPELNNEVFEDGWFKTGDIGFIDNDGCFVITGRKKLIINSGGFNIAPEEVTEVIHKHPSIRAAVTFGEEDKMWGEIVVSAIEIKDSTTLSKEEIIAHCRQYLEERKVPAKIYFVDKLPYGRSGKVKIEEIKKQILFKSEKQQTKNETILNFKTIVSSCFDLHPEDISLEMIADNTPEWDSIAHLVLIAEIEKQYNIQFTPVEVMNINVLSELYNLIQNKVEQ